MSTGLAATKAFVATSSSKEATSSPGSSLSRLRWRFKGMAEPLLELPRAIGADKLKDVGHAQANLEPKMLKDASKMLKASFQPTSQAFRH